VRGERPSGFGWRRKLIAFERRDQAGKTERNFFTN
jgi:hypothetical protein